MPVEYSPAITSVKFAWHRWEQSVVAVCAEQCRFPVLCRYFRLVQTDTIKGLQLN